MNDSRNSLTVGSALAEEVRAEAARQLINQKDLATRSGMVHSTLHRKFRGEAPWTVDDLVMVAKGLDTDPHALLRAAIAGAELAEVSA